MTLRKCIFDLKIILNGVFDLSERPLKLSTSLRILLRRLFTSQPELRTDYYAPFFKPVTHRVAPKLVKLYSKNFCR